MIDLNVTPMLTCILWPRPSNQLEEKFPIMISPTELIVNNQNRHEQHKNVVINSAYLDMKPLMPMDSKLDFQETFQDGLNMDININMDTRAINETIGNTIIIIVIITRYHQK